MSVSLAVFADSCTKMRSCTNFALNGPCLFLKPLPTVSVAMVDSANATHAIMMHSKPTNSI